MLQLNIYRFVASFFYFARPPTQKLSISISNKEKRGKQNKLFNSSARLSTKISLPTNFSDKMAWSMSSEALVFLEDSAAAYTRELNMSNKI